MLTTTGAYDDALIRIHRTGPELEGYLSNHGPMVVEVLGRRNEDASIDRWTDAYLTRLDELPHGTWAIDRSTGRRHSRASKELGLGRAVPA